MTMHLRTFGKTNWRISEVGFGAWAIGGGWGPQDDAESRRTLHAAIDRGVNFIDTAQGYGDGHSETIIGEVLRERSEEVYVATKVPPVPDSTTWPPPDDADARIMYPADYIISQCEGSLRRLKREAVDIYQFHTWSAGFNAQDEWYEAVVRLKEQGKIRAFGASVPDTKPGCVVGAVESGRVDAVQAVFNIFEQRPKEALLPACERAGACFIARVPFDEGALTGKYTAETTFPEGDIRSHYFRSGNLAATVRRVEAIRTFKDERHPTLSMAEYALRYVLSHSGVTTVIPGMRNRQQVVWNTAAGDGQHLEANEVREMARLAWEKDFWFEEEGEGEEEEEGEEEGEGAAG